MPHWRRPAFSLWNSQDTGERKDNHTLARFIESSTDTLQAYARREIMRTVDVVHVGEVQAFAIVVIARNGQDRGSGAESFFHLVENFGIVLIGPIICKVTGQYDSFEVAALCFFEYPLKMFLDIEASIIFTVQVNVGNLK